MPNQIRKKGFLYTEWHQIRARNEALDLEVMQLGAVEVLNPDLKAIAARIKIPAVEALREVLPPALIQPKRIFKLARPKFRRKWQ